MATTKLSAELEIDHERGVIYVHLANPQDIAGVHTALRVSGLPTPIPQIKDHGLLDVGIRATIDPGDVGMRGSKKLQIVSCDWTGR